MSFESQFESASLSPGFLFWKASNLHQRLQRRALEPLKLTPTEFSVLACFFSLSEQAAGGVSQARVCAYAALDKMLVSTTTRALERKRLLVRRQDAGDKRAMVVTVSTVGQRVCNQAIARIEKVDAEFFGRIGKTSEVLQIFKTLLDERSP